MAYLWLNQAFNIHIGDDPGVAKDNDKSKIIGNLSFPDLEEMTATHHPGGSRFGINFGGMGMNPLTVRFSASGWDPQSMSQFGIYDKDNIFFTLRAYIKNKNGGANSSVTCVTRGRMTKVTPSQLTRGSMATFDHEIQEVDIYRLTFDGKPKYNFSFWDNVYEVDGKPQNSDELLALGIV